MTRLEIITEARSRVGKRAQALNLTYAYDGVTQLMSTKYPLIPHQRATGSCVSGTAYITPPSVNIRDIEKVMLGSPLSEVEYFDPELFNQFKGASNAFPNKWTYQKCQVSFGSLLTESGLEILTESGVALLTESFELATRKLVSLYPAPDSAYGYAMYYGVINAKSDDDDYVHSMTEYLDESVVLGVSWKAAEIGGEYKKALDFKNAFLADLAQRAEVVMMEFLVEE